MTIADELVTELFKLKRLARMWAGQDAEDLLQAAYVKALSNTDQFKGGNLAGWLTRIMFTTFMDNKRRNQRTVLMSEPPEDVAFPNQEASYALNRAIEVLGNNSMLLPNAYGYTRDEIASHTNLSKAKVHRTIVQERFKIQEH